MAAEIQSYGLAEEVALTMAGSGSMTKEKGLGFPAAVHWSRAAVFGICDG